MKSKYFSFVCFCLSVFFAVIISGCKKDKLGSENYPEDFPDSCVEYFDRWSIYLKKMEDSKRFDSESITAFRLHREAALAVVSGKGGAFLATPERKKNYCLLNERSDAFFKPIDNMDDLTQSELEDAIKLDDIKRIYSKKSK